VQWPAAAAVVVVMIVSVSGLVTAFARRERARALDRWRAQLSAMADDREISIERFVLDGLDHARTVAEYPSVRRLATTGQERGASVTGLLSHLRQLLAAMAANGGYVGAVVLDREGRPLVGGGGDPRMGPGCRALVRRVMETGEPSPEFCLNGGTGPLLAFAAPVSAETGQRLAGVVLLTMDPEAWLYPVLRHQPLASATEETLLVRQDGQDVVYLSPLRGVALPSASVRLPLATPRLVSAAALRGGSAFGVFRDYQGHEVLAITCRVKSAPWGIVAKVDVTEAFAGARESVRFAALAASGIAAGLILALAGGWLALEARARAALTRTAARFSVLLDEASDAILLVGADGSIRDANRRAADLYGYSREELQGLHVSMLRLDKSPEEVARLLSAVGSESEWLWESVHVTRDGRELPVEVAARAVEMDGERLLVSIIRDVAARRRTEQALRESEARYRSLFEANQDGVILAVAGGRVLDANPAALAMFAWTLEEFRGLTRDDFLDLGDPRLLPALAERERKGRFVGLLRFRRRDGSTFEGELSSVLIPAQGGEARASLVVRDVTERQRAEGAIRASEVRYRSLFANMLNGVALCRMLFEDGSPVDFVYLEVNEAFERLTGLAGVTGRRVTEVIPGIRETNPELFAAYARVIATGEPEHLETWVPALGIWFSISAYRPEPGHFVAVFDNITERKRRDEEIRRLNADLERRVAERTAEVERYAREVEDLYNRAPCGYHSLDPDGHFLTANDTELEWLGYSREELLGKRFTDIVAPGSVETFTANFPGFKERGSVRDLEFEVLRKDGSSLWLLVSATAVRDREGNYLRSRSTLFDVSKLVHVRRQVAERTAALEAANLELEAFSYSVSHDLRAPLRAIAGFSQLLAKDYETLLDAEGRRLLGVVRENAIRMDQLIRDLLAFSRVGRGEMESQTVGMQQLVNEVVTELAASLDRETLEIAVGPLPDARGDEAMLRQVWLNLLANAIKFSAPREKARVVVEGRRSDGEVVYSVADNGVGFDMRHAGKLFGVFQRLHGVAEFPGTGVGLAIVQRIVHRHGGRVLAEGKVDEGATFSFALPAARAGGAI